MGKNTIRRYRFGNPTDTDAVVLKLPAETGEIPRLKAEPVIDPETGSEKGIRFSFGMDPEDILFGLGETVRGQNKRGHRYTAWNTDEVSHTEDKQSLYASHNLLLIFGPGKLFGIFLDDPGRITWDLGYTRQDQAVIVSENGDLDLYILEGESLTEIAREFRHLTGRSYLPPRWAFGYIQSRWGYASEEEIRQVVGEHRKWHIPLDGICMDIDYMERFRDFTWRKDAFPDMKAFVREMQENHIHLIPIIDAGIARVEGYEPYETGRERGAFCTLEDGSAFEAAVWPGLCCFPDFLNGDAREWFGEQYRPLLEAGIDGFWNDMNEPSLFYTKERLNKAFEKAMEQQKHPEDYEGMWNLKSVFNGVESNPEDYRLFYHRTDDGERIRHDRVHNLYGAQMTRATAGGFRAFDPEHRFLLFSRSSYVGAHRNGGVWMGDNRSWWSHLELAVQMLPNMNLCGFLYCGCDLGGFAGDVTEDLLERFLQLGVFLPLMRNHSALYTRDQEVYRFSTVETMRNTITVRYALIPYLYSEFMKAALTDGMLFRPLAFDYPADPRACRVEDQLMLGGECMIAPVCRQNAWGRYVYLPEDMLMIRFRSASDYDLVSLEKGDHYIELKPEEFPLFVKRGRFIPLGAAAEYTDSVTGDGFRLIGWDAEKTEYALYADDGISTTPVYEEHLKILREGFGQ